MFTTAVIAFREFFEAFLIVGVFLGVSKTLGLKREVEIALAAILGILVSLFLAVGAYTFGDHIRGILTEENAEFLESYLLLFSGFFIAYIVFSLHGMLGKGHREMIRSTKKRFEEKAFDISLFFTIMLLVMREGFEIALFTSSISLFATFVQNFLGLLIGLVVASILGVSTFFAYMRFEVGKVFQATEYLIILLGASLTQLGTTKLFETHFGINLSEFGPLHFGFLPDGESVLGHVLQSMFGIDRDFSVVRLSIMLIYIALMYILFIRTRSKKPLRAEG